MFFENFGLNINFRLKKTQIALLSLRSWYVFSKYYWLNCQLPVQECTLGTFLVLPLLLLLNFISKTPAHNATLDSKLSPASVMIPRPVLWWIHYLPLSVTTFQNGKSSSGLAHIKWDTISQHLSPSVTTCHHQSPSVMSQVKCDTMMVITEVRVIAVQISQSWTLKYYLKITKVK